MFTTSMSATPIPGTAPNITLLETTPTITSTRTDAPQQILYTLHSVPIPTHLSTFPLATLIHGMANSTLLLAHTYTTTILQAPIVPMSIPSI